MEGRPGDGASVASLMRLCGEDLLSRLNALIAHAAFARHGEKYWAWIFWCVNLMMSSASLIIIWHRRCEVKVQELLGAQEISVRAQDCRKNYQPEHMTW